jgi:hypothetical protein
MGKTSVPHEHYDLRNAATPRSFPSVSGVQTQQEEHEPYGVDRDWSWTPGVLRPEQQRKAAGGDAELLPALALLSRLGVGRSGAAGRWWWMAVAVAAPICEEAVSGAIKENNLGEEEGAKGRP